MPLLSSYVPTSHVLPLYSTDPPSFHWNVSPFFSAWSAWDSSAVSAFFQTGIKRSAEAFSSSGKVSWTLSAFLPAGVAYADALGHLDLKPDEVGLLGDGGLFLALALGGAAAADALPPQPTRANAAKRAMQRERIDRVFFFMMASSLSADDITAPRVVGVLIALAADVSVYCAAIPPFVVCGRRSAAPQRVPYL